jgi:hypothetical protein
MRPRRAAENYRSSATISFQKCEEISYNLARKRILPCQFRHLTIARLKAKV